MTGRWPCSVMRLFNLRKKLCVTQFRRLARKCCLGAAIIIDGHRMDILIHVKISWPLSHIAGPKIMMEERGL